MVCYFYVCLFFGFTVMEKSSLDILLCSKIIQYLNNMRIFTQSIANNTDHSVSQLI